MTKEAYCSFEVAKLLKEKGFDKFIDFGWDEQLFDKEYPRNFSLGFDNKEHWISCPTHQMAMAWLREEKYILIFMVPAKDESGNLQYMADVFTWNEDEGLYESTWCTANYVYEKAVETALKYALENLIKEDEK